MFRASGHEHLTGSLVVPVLDERGAVSELYGRKITDDHKLRAGTPLHLYLPGPHRGVWNLEALAASEEIVLTESLIDALTLWCAGFRHVTASYGTEGFTADHREAFAEHNTRRVLIGYDNDGAGNIAATKLATSLLAEGIECFRVQLPVGQDVNDVAVGAKNPTDVLSRAIRQASWMGKGTAPATRRQAAPTEALPSAAAVGDVDETPAESEPEPSPEPAELLVGPAEPVPPSVVSPALPTLAEEDMPLVSEREVLLSFGERRWRVRGLGKASSFDLLRVNVMCSVPDGRGGIRFHVDTLDLYSARARASFLVAASAELGVTEDVVKRDLGRVLLACEQLADQVVTDAQTPVDEPPRMTDAEKAGPGPAARPGAGRADRGGLRRGRDRG